jgi:AAA+ superfamily predicted ATPase
MLFGPPGTGKTLFAEKLARESKMGMLYFIFYCIMLQKVEDPYFFPQILP